MNLNNIFNGLLSNKKLLVILFVVALFIGIAIYIYKTNIQSKIQPEYVENKEFVSGGGDSIQKEAEFYFFFTEWCPHCKKAKPIIQQLENDYQNQTINNTKIIFRNIDCDKDEKTADDFNVEGYPTIKLLTNGQVIEYDAKPDYDNLVEFLKSSL
jgi:thiol-disulfide isomerase/thioredoxin